jgi:hypothetical protein
MMVFKKALFGTAPAVLAHECAATIVSKPYRPFDFRWDMSRVRNAISAFTRTVGGSQLLFGDALQERRQRQVKDFCWISVGNLMTQEILRDAKLLVSFGACRELNLVTLWRQGDDSRWTISGGRGGERRHVLSGVFLAIPCGL